jgi:NitT/TauT family transport system substrate-binding protein
MRKRKYSMPIQIKSIVAASTAIALAMSVAGAARADDKVSLRLNFLLSGVHTIFYGGKAAGAYRAEGIDLDIGEGQGSARTIQTVANGGDMFGLADGGSVIAGATRGAPVISVMGILNKSPYGISFRADAKVTTIKDVEGKLIAVSAGEASLALLQPLWDLNGVDASKVRTLTVDGAGKIVAVLQKRVDGILAGLENQVIVLKQKGLEQTVFAFADLGMNTEGLTILVTKSTFANKPDLIARFVRATRKAIELARKDPDAAVAAALAEKPQGDKELLRPQLIASLDLLESPASKGHTLGYMAPEDWVRTLELMKKYQDVTTDLKATEFYTDLFVEK